MKALSLCLVASLAGTAHAGQPISESMVDCAAIFSASNRWFPEKAGGEKGLALAHAANRFLEAAMHEATAERRDDPAGFVADLLPQKEAAWDEKGMTFPFTQEFRDWADYCRALARDRKIDLTPR